MPHRYGSSHAIWDHTVLPGRGDIPALTPAEAGTRLSDPRGMQGWVDLVGLLQTHTHTCLTARPFVQDYPGEPVPEGKTNLDFTEARDSEWHQLGYMQVCTSLQTDNHTSTRPLSFFTGRVPFLPPNQQRQSTEGWLHAEGTHCTHARSPIQVVDGPDVG